MSMLRIARAARACHEAVVHGHLHRETLMHLDLRAASLLVSAVFVLPACVEPTPPPNLPEPAVGVAVLGAGEHSLSAVIVDEIGSAGDGLNGPRDLEFNPEVPGELWVVNRIDDSTVTYKNAGTSTQQATKLIDPYALHFMEEVSSVAFADGLRFGTCQESRNTYNGQAFPDDFMGPALWSADPAIYAKSNPAAVAEVGFDLGSHLDMLHESPLCMGIAWERDNVYWTFDGLSGTLSRYDFVQDHGAGFDDHRDGTVERYVEAGVLRVGDVPSHLAFEAETGLVYVADTGNARIAVLDPAGGVPDAALTPMEPGVSLITMIGVRAEDVVAPGQDGLVHPSGLALHDGMIFTSDNATSRILAFTLEGELVDYLDTELPEGSLMGITFDDEGRLYAVDFLGDRVLRYSAR